MPFPTKIRRALRACFGVGKQGRRDEVLVIFVVCCDCFPVTMRWLFINSRHPPQQVWRPVKEADPARSGVDGTIRAIHVKGTVEGGCQANDMLAERLGTLWLAWCRKTVHTISSAADLSEVARRAEELAARLEQSEAARSQLEGALAEATSARRQLEQELANARQREEAAARAAPPASSGGTWVDAQATTHHQLSTAVSTIVFSDDSDEQGGKRLVPALGHLDAVTEGLATLAAELAAELDEVRMLAQSYTWWCVHLV